MSKHTFSHRKAQRAKADNIRLYVRFTNDKPRKLPPIRHIHFRKRAEELMAFSRALVDAGRYGDDHQLALLTDGESHPISGCKFRVHASELGHMPEMRQWVEAIALLGGEGDPPCAVRWTGRVNCVGLEHYPVVEVNIERHEAAMAVFELP